VAATAHARAVRRAADQVWGFAPAGWRNLATPATHDPKGRGAVVHDIRGDLVDLEVDGVRSTYVVTADGGDADETMPLTSWVSGRGWTSEIVVTPRFPVAVQAQVAGGSVAPVPGTVTAVLVEVGAQVSTGDTLIVLEAMKMEHRIGASGAGQVTAVHVRPGDAVDAHQPLVTLEVAPDE
jgi:propionyl-CoA carboxylase alpha chain